MAKETVVKNFFDIMNICMKKLPRPEPEVVDKHCIQWMLNSYLSCSESLAPLGAHLSTLKMSNREYFDILYYAIPKSNAFIRYSATKAKSDALIKNICVHYSCSVEVAKQYIGLISEAELAHIEELYEEKGVQSKGKKK